MEWWTLWRRVAGGLDEAAQQRLLDDFAINLRGDEAGVRERPPRLVHGGWDEMVRMGASLERIPVDHKVEIGDWLVEHLRQPGAAANPQARDLPLEARERVIARLEALRAAPSWISRVRDVVPLDEAGERAVFGEALPPGLKLIG